MRRRLFAAAAIAMLAAAGCTSEDDPEVDQTSSALSSTPAATSRTAMSTPASTPAPSPTVTSSPAFSSAQPTPPPSTSPSSGPNTIGIVVAGGKVQTPDKTPSLKLGSTVTLLVSSDVADEVHVHGYELKKQVAAGATVEITFKADQPGTWEIELHDSGLALIRLQVR